MALCMTFVCYITGEFMQHLRQQQNNRNADYIDIPEQDESCVGIAGLCHDLGHGHSHISLMMWQQSHY